MGVPHVPGAAHVSGSSSRNRRSTWVGSLVSIAPFTMIPGTHVAVTVKVAVTLIATVLVGVGGVPVTVGVGVQVNVLVEVGVGVGVLVAHSGWKKVYCRPKNMLN